MAVTLSFTRYINCDCDEPQEFKILMLKICLSSWFTVHNEHNTTIIHPCSCKILIKMFLNWSVVNEESVPLLNKKLLIKSIHHNLTLLRGIEII